MAGLRSLAIPVAVLAIPFVIVGLRYGPVGWDYVVDDSSCVGCHKERNEHLVMQWIGSAHFSADVGCADCHGEDHDAMFAIDGDVSPKICAECHADEYEEFARSGHTNAAEAAEKNARFLAAPAVIQRQGCMTCHDIGRTWPDGGKGQCNYCHSGHRFSAEEARAPEACEVCHMGPDHPQMEAWRASKHGVVFHSLQDAETAPTCVSCHMGGESGHDSTLNLTLGHVSAGAVLEGSPPPVPMRTITRAQFEERRGRMVRVCRRCHSESFARRSLDDADEIKRLADGLLAEAAQIIREVEAEGLLSPMPERRPPHPEAGHAVVLGGGQLYSDTSQIEQRFFEMSKFHHATTFKGAYHNSPDHTHWLGYAAMQADLTAIRTEAARLRLARPVEVPPPEPAPDAGVAP